MIDHQKKTPRRQTITKRNYFYLLICFLVIFGSMSCYGSKNQIEGVAEIPISFLDNKFAYIPLIIDDNEFFLQIDTGSSGSISLNKKYSKYANSQKTGSTKSYQSVKGMIYQVDEVIFPNVILGKWKMGNIKGREDSEWLDGGGHIQGENNLSSHRNGVIGRGFFKDFKTVIDLKKGKLLLAKNISDLEKIGYAINDWPLIACDKTSIGIVFNAKINKKKGKFILDSGASHSILKKTFFNKKDTNSQIDFLNIDSIQVGNSTYSNTDFVLYNFLEPSEVEGVFGIDFLKNKVIYFDMRNQILRIK